MSMAAERVVCSDCETRDEIVNFSAKKNGNIISGKGRAMVRASPFGGAALIAGVLCLVTCTTRVGGRESLHSRGQQGHCGVQRASLERKACLAVHCMRNTRTGTNS